MATAAVTDARVARARGLVAAMFSEYHKQPVNPWTGKDGPGEFAEIIARHLLDILPVAADRLGGEEFYVRASNPDGDGWRWEKHTVPPGYHPHIAMTVDPSGALFVYYGANMVPRIYAPGTWLILDPVKKADDAG